MDVDKEYQELIGKNQKNRIPTLERGVPSMYSKDGKEIYLKSYDLVVGSNTESFVLAKSLFEGSFKSPFQGNCIPPNYNQKKDYERILDQEILAKWIKTKFRRQADKDLKAKIRTVLGEGE